jgi:hypothetical protein
MAEKKSRNEEMNEEEVDLVADEKLFLKKLLRILDRLAPKLKSEQEQTRENYNNVDWMQMNCIECSQKEPHEDGPKSGWSQDEELKTGNKTTEVGRIESNADKSNIQFVRDRKEGLQEQIREELKLCKQTETELEKKANLHQIVREKLRKEKVQRQTREQKLLNGIKEREYLQNRLKYEQKACENFETKIRKESNQRQRLQEDLEKTMSFTKVVQKKLMEEIKLTEYLQTQSETGNVHYMAKEEVKTLSNRHLKPLESKTITQTGNNQLEKHEERGKDSLQEVSGNSMCSL